jgi:hypothetical protein
MPTMMKSMRMKCTALPAAISVRSCSTAVVPSSAVRRVALAKGPAFSLSISLATTLMFNDESSCKTQTHIQSTLVQYLAYHAATHHNQQAERGQGVTLLENQL